MNLLEITPWLNPIDQLEERLSEKEIRETALNKQPLHPNKHAYIQRRSTHTALDTVVNRIERAMENKLLHLMNHSISPKRSWDLKPKIALWIYAAMVSPMLCYEALVWWPRARQKTRAMKTTPIAALETLLCLAPLNLYIEEAAMRTFLRLHSLGVWNKQGHITKHTRILMEAFNRIALLRMEERADIDIYVDGAKTDSCSGAGIYSEQLNAQICVPPGTHTSVLQTEVMGIMLGARIVAEREIGNKSICILIDSKSALLALNSCMMNSVELCRIKGHSGNEGNERADEMAKRAQYTHRRHEQIWTTLSSCWQSRACIATPDRFLTGDYQFDKQLHTVGMVTDPICRGCNEEEETAEHVRRECSAVASCRKCKLRGHLAWYGKN
ncbi:uncharacterized protein LOC135145323 [Zophobas morio]|uniref:uncharacterized protein LOC135145323 n=1 Tax=Zophobas morio TaxID=2755281 RepID=UPI00308284AC